MKQPDTLLWCGPMSDSPERTPEDVLARPGEDADQEHERPARSAPDPVRPGEHAARLDTLASAIKERNKRRKKDTRRSRSRTALSKTLQRIMK